MASRDDGDAFFPAVMIVLFLVFALFAAMAWPQKLQDCDDSCGGPGKGAMVKGVMTYECICRGN